MQGRATALNKESSRSQESGGIIETEVNRVLA